MNTLSEIEAAIARLPETELEALENRVLVRRFGLDALCDRGRAELLGSLDEADREIDAGKGISANALRQKLRLWVRQ